MLVSGLIETMKVLKMCLRLLERLINRKILAILKARITEVEPPS